ncbi:MAG: hypothetical protein ACT4QC_24370 [Planctomycetaceae bacterium]
MNRAFHGTCPAFDLSDAGAAPDSDDPRILALGEEFISALEAGLRPRIAVYAGRYPELKERVSEFLEVVEFLGVVGPSFPSRVAEMKRDAAGLTSNQRPAVGLPGLWRIVSGRSRAVRR